MKILQIAHGFPPQNLAGTELYTFNLSAKLSEKNEVFVFYRINDRKKEEYSINHSEFNGMNIYSINNTFKLCDSFEAVYSNKIIDNKFGALLDELKPDIAHIQHLLFLSIGIVDELKKRSIPVVFTLNDYWLICQQGQLFNKNNIICDDLSGYGCVKCFRYHLNIKKGVMPIYEFLKARLTNAFLYLAKQAYFLSSRLLLIFRNQSAIKKIKNMQRSISEIIPKVELFIAPSYFIRNRFIKYGIPEEKIAYSSYGLEQKIFTGAKKNESGKIRFGFIGTLIPSKGLHILIKAVNRISDKNIELNIYGNLKPYKGTEYYIKYILSLAKKKKHIYFKGAIDNKNITGAFANIDVLIVPSIWLENAPLVIKEAFLAKVPVIASRIGGIPELIENGENGFLFEPRNVNALRDKLKYIIGQPETIEKLKINMPKVKNIEENAKEMQAIYYKLTHKI